APDAQNDAGIKGGHIYNMGPSIPFPINGTVAHITFSHTVNRKIQYIFQKKLFDIIHIHEPLLPGLSLAALRASNAITIGTFHAYPEAQLLSVPSLGYAALAPLARSAFCRLTGRIAVSSVAQQFVAHFFPAEYCVIPNGVDTDRFNPRIPPLPEFMDDKRNILFVGRFDQRKGAKYLAQAISLIRTHHPRTRFLFVGDGHLRPYLQRLVRQQGWPDVLFAGYVPADILPRYFASAHVFCSPATGGESMGIVLLEAMASGIPLVATAIPGYMTVAEDGKDALLVAPRDSNDLAQAINRLLADPHLYQQLRIQGLEKACGFAWSSVAQRIEGYYLELLETSKVDNVSSKHHVL
ncbi:MAG TPA: glycosyltransferase family 4 protein, partial [Ktedonobacteraceae bacterium]